MSIYPELKSLKNNLIELLEKWYTTVVLEQYCLGPYPDSTILREVKSLNSQCLSSLICEMGIIKVRTHMVVVRIKLLNL